MVTLPKGIDYTQYQSTNGMSTKFFGPAAWDFLFVSIIGRYPVKINKKDPEHLLIRKSFKHLMQSLSIVLPCIFCRQSFAGFLKELPLKPFLSGRIELMYWLYLMKDRVNKKLLKQ